MERMQWYTRTPRPFFSDFYDGLSANLRGLVAGCIVTEPFVINGLIIDLRVVEFDL